VRGALLKAAIMAAFALGVLAEIATKLARGLVPDATIMWGVAVVALVANAAALALLWSRREDDVNMRSAWLCSRNDVLANVGVLFAGFAVGLTGSAWPDIVVGLAIAALFGLSANQVIRQALMRPEPARVDAVNRPGVGPPGLR
jgi:Co/Zn/Cd efflux system component